MADNENEVSLTDSAIMSDSGVHSTQVSPKERKGSMADMMNVLQLLLDQQNTMSSDMRTMSNDVSEVKQQNVNLRGNINEIKERNVKFENSITRRYDELIDSEKHMIEEMKEQQRVLFDEMKGHCDIIQKMKERKEKWKRDTGNFNENKDYQIIDDKVSDSDSESNNDNDMRNNNGDIIENVVSERCILNNGSDDESLMGVEVRGEVRLLMRLRKSVM